MWWRRTAPCAACRRASRAKRRSNATSGPGKRCDSLRRPRDRAAQGCLHVDPDHDLLREPATGETCVSIHSLRYDFLHGRAITFSPRSYRTWKSRTVLWAEYQNEMWERQRFGGVSITLYGDDTKPICSVDALVLNDRLYNIREGLTRHVS